MTENGVQLVAKGRLLTGMNALVTGASSGIGEATVRALVNAGAQSRWCPGASRS
jgi:NADP-dependent 3-hydroxy acid dehydrogenase YdfG